jgi:hypothetical protein
VEVLTELVWPTDAAVLAGELRANAAAPLALEAAADFDVAAVEVPNFVN